MEWVIPCFDQVNWGIASLLFVLGIGAFLLSTISGGGGALVLIPVINWTLGATHTAPVLNLGTLIGRPARLILFWHSIHWRLCLYYIPAAMVGAWLGAWLFVEFRAEWLQIIIGLFLVSTAFQYRMGKKEKSFTTKEWHFAPLGLVIAMTGTMVGAMGPVLNPFYLNFGLKKEAMIATKTANSFFMGISQIGSYTFFGLLYQPFWTYGIALGAGAVIGNILGKKYLVSMKNVTFRKWVIAMMVISGVALIIKQIMT